MLQYSMTNVSVPKELFLSNSILLDGLITLGGKRTGTAVGDYITVDEMNLRDNGEIVVDGGSYFLDIEVQEVVQHSGALRTLLSLCLCVVVLIFHMVSD